MSTALDIETYMFDFSEKNDSDYAIRRRNIKPDNIKTLLATKWLREWTKTKFKTKIEFKRCYSTASVVKKIFTSGYQVQFH